MASNNVYVCSLDKVSIKKAKEELNENPEDRLAAVQALRDWVNEQPHIKCPQTDTLFLLRFLRWAKFSQIKARQKLELYLNLKNRIPKVYVNVDTREANMQELIDGGYVFMLPNHPNGNPIIAIRQETLSQFDWPMSTFMRTFISLLEHVCTKEINHIHGTMLFIDYSRANMASIRKLMTKESANMFKEWMRCTTGRLGTLHLYRAGMFVDIFLTFFKPLMKKKLYDRIVINDTMESVYQFIPKECLPSEYLSDDYTGPNAGNMKDCIKKTKEAILDGDFHDYLLYRTNDAFGIDLSKKPENTVTEHFRKLNVD